MKVLVTGADGFLGYNLVGFLSKKGMAVKAWIRNLGEKSWQSDTLAESVDITKTEEVKYYIKDYQPDIVIHLAAQSIPNTSWIKPEETIHTNILGTLNILEAIKEQSNNPRLIFAGSSAEYAETEAGYLIKEDNIRKPNSPYGASKVAAVDFCLMYGERYELDVVIFRPFSICGPGKVGDLFSDLARRIVEIENKKRDFLRVGDLNIFRDIIDVRDFLTGIECIIKHGLNGHIYNICSGKSISVHEIVELYRKLSKVDLILKQDANLIRPQEHKAKIGNPLKLKQMGWSIEHQIISSLENILDYWRNMYKI